MVGGTRCPVCQLPHVGIRECYRDRLVAALSMSAIDSREERTLRWLATILEEQAAAVLIGMIGVSRGDAYLQGRRDAMAASRGKAPNVGASPFVTAWPSVQAEGVTAPPLEAAIGSPECYAARARIARNLECSCGGVAAAALCPCCRNLGNR